MRSLVGAVCPGRRRERLAGFFVREAPALRAAFAELAPGGFFFFCGLCDWENPAGTPGPARKDISRTRSAARRYFMVTLFLVSPVRITERCPPGLRRAGTRSGRGRYLACGGP